jgi:excisionase family DNA binding protein
MKRYLKVEETADVLRCSKRTVQAAIARGDIPAVRLPGMRRVLIDPDALEQALTNSEVRP